jgi:hypothetical protein
MSGKKTGIEKVKPEKKRGRAGDSVAAMRTAAAAVGVSIGDARQVPTVDVGMQHLPLARELGMILKRENVFRRGGQVLFWNDQTCEMASMDSLTFLTEVENYVALVRNTDKGARPASLTKSQADMILSAPSFKNQLRELCGVHDVRLLVWAEHGKSIRKLPEGYDEKTGVFTHSAFQYDETMPPLEARDFLLDFCKDFPFPGEERLILRRGVACHVGAMLTVFLRLFFLPSKSNGLRNFARPLFHYAADETGSGKTLLVTMALAPVFGEPDIQTLDQNEEGRVKSEIDSAVIDGTPYIFFDEVKNRLISPSLQAALTSGKMAGRKLGGTSRFGGANVLQFFTAGNQVTFSPDIGRRSIVIKLLSKVEAGTRKFDRPITKEWLVEFGTRARICAALYSLVKAWEEAGCPPGPKTWDNSFAEWSKVIGGIVTNAGFADPVQSGNEAGMNPDRLAWEKIRNSFAAEVQAGEAKTWKLEDWIERAEELEEIANVLGMRYASESRSPGSRKSFGVKLVPYMKQFQDGQGRWCELLKTSGSAVAYKLRVFTDSQAKELGLG